MQPNQIPIVDFSSSSGSKILLIIEPLTEIEQFLSAGLEVKMAAQSSQTLGWIKRSLDPSKLSPFLHWSHFLQACVIHDLCYITPGASQKDCDVNMLVNTIAIHFENVKNGSELRFGENLFYFLFQEFLPRPGSECGLPLPWWRSIWNSFSLSFQYNIPLSQSLLLLVICPQASGTQPSRGASSSQSKPNAGF